MISVPAVLDLVDLFGPLNLCMLHPLQDLAQMACTALTSTNQDINTQHYKLGHAE